jgi:hypothetical protein
MPFSFPWWVFVWGMIGYAWPVSLVLGLGLGAIALRSHGGKQIVFMVMGSVVLVLTGTAVLSFADAKVIDKLNDEKGNAREASLRETLSQPRTVLDATLPAGTVVQWNDEARVDFRWLQLPRPTRVLGLMLTGSLQDDSQTRRWEGELAEDQTVEGWPCRKGDVQISYERALADCILASDQKAHGLVVPAGTHLQFNPDYNTEDYLLPADRTMSMPDIGIVVPSGSEVDMRGGLPETVKLQESLKGLSIRGVPLDGEIKWHYRGSDDNNNAQVHLKPPPDRIDGSLAQLFSCGGKSFPAKAQVKLSMTDNVMIISSEADATPDVTVKNCLR